MKELYNAILISPEDNVATVIKQIEAGENVSFSRLGEPVELRSGGVPIYHKIAVRDITKGADVVKYGETIAAATEDIPAGTHVHTHNIASGVQ